MRREVDRALEMVAARQDGVFSRTQAEEAGADVRLRHRRLRSGLWARVGAAGFRFASTPLTWLGSLRAAVWDGGDRALVSHDAAAQIERFPGFHQNETHILVPKALDHVCTIARVHESRRFDLVRSRLVHGLPVVAPADTLIHVATGMRSGRIAWLTEELLFTKRLNLSAVNEALGRLGPGCRGLGPLRTVVADYAPGDPIPESELEKRFIQVATAFGLPPFDRQVVLPGRDQMPGRVDFVWLASRLIVEVDGRRWHARFADFDRDHRRDLYWLSQGYRTARITWSMLLHDPEQVCRDLLAAILAAA